MSLEIKFSHNYYKLCGQKSATLLKVSTCRLSELSEPFLLYDTAYPGGYYPLKEGAYMVLTFTGNERIPFTTIRPFNESKMQYYRQNIGMNFDIVIKPQ